ncbi:MAG TPA: hypothetical protein VFY73_09210 [Ideonella sp.]|uniref:hypothetical protein n=1 Tax=Ideonella sp. TaxID=1929293 RepID=UPI002E305137|nr:hypothetical protein [Ideonella sp.]HEX5684202.1 hypothetical protein [Ideonella sp.]
MTHPLTQALPRVALALITLAASAAIAGTPPMYRIEKVKRDETGHLKAHSARSINNDGVVVGWSRVDNFGYIPFMLDGRRPQQMQGPAASAMYNGQTINIRREVAGSIYPNAYLWDSAGTPLNLGPLLPCTGTKSSASAAINDAGVAVGNYTCTVNRKTRYGAWIYRDGQMADLGTLGGAGNQVYGINNSGQVVGGAGALVNGKAVTHAYLWQDGVMQDLGTLGEDNSEATAINEAGYVVGRSYGSYPAGSQAFVYKDGTMKAMPTCAGNTLMPSAINNHGQVVGNFRVRYSQTAVLVHQGQCYFLSALLDDSAEDWRDLWVYDINDDGVIVGEGNKGAFVATPLRR